MRQAEFPVRTAEPERGRSVLVLLAGTLADPGSADGVGSLARFRRPEGIVTDAAGYIYVADTGNHTLRKITPGGTVTTLAGQAGVPGNTNGIGSTATLSSPFGLAVDAAGHLYVADQSNHAIRKISPAGNVTLFAGSATGDPGSADGTGVDARFYFPTGVATDSTGNVYVADTENCTIRKITPAGIVTTLAGQPGIDGCLDGSGAAATFSFPSGVAADATGQLYVADTGAYLIRKISPDGTVTTLAGKARVPGSADGTGSAARFYRPEAVVVDGTGRVYVADTENCTIRRITAAGAVTTLVGNPACAEFAPGALPGTLDLPVSLALHGTTLYFTQQHGVAVVTNLE